MDHVLSQRTIGLQNMRQENAGWRTMRPWVNAGLETQIRFWTVVREIICRMSSSDISHAVRSQEELQCVRQLRCRWRSTNGHRSSAWLYCWLTTDISHKEVVFLFNALYFLVMLETRQQYNQHFLSTMTCEKTKIRLATIFLYVFFFAFLVISLTLFFGKHSRWPKCQDIDFPNAQTAVFQAWHSFFYRGELLY